MHRVFTHALALLIGAALAGGMVAIAAPDHSSTLPAQVAQLQRDDARLKRAVGNLCVWFKHAPAAVEFPKGDEPLSSWLYDVGLGCDTFGLH